MSQEKRRSIRRITNELFSMFIVLPKTGSIKIDLRDLSNHGMSFVVDNEILPSLDLKENQIFDTKLYLSNKSFIPVTIRIVRFFSDGEVQINGCEFVNLPKDSQNAVDKLLDFIDSMASLA